MFAQVGIDVAVPSYTSRVDTDIHYSNQEWCVLSVEPSDQLQINQLEVKMQQVVALAGTIR